MTKSAAFRLPTNFLTNMISSERFICGDCKGFTAVEGGSAEMSGIVKFFLNIILPGITIFLKRRRKKKMICSYCGSDFLLPADAAETQSLLKSMEKIDTRIR